MEPNATSATSSTQAPESEPSTSGTSSRPNLPVSEPQPSTSQNYSSSLVMPSRILAMKKQPTEAHSTQTSDSRKHKSSENSHESTEEKRSKSNDSGPSSSSHTETATQTQTPRKILIINDKERNQPEPSTSRRIFLLSEKEKNQQEPSSSGLQEKPVRNSGVRILCPKKRKLPNMNEAQPGCSNEPQPSTSRESTSEDILLNIRPIADEVRSRFLPIIKSLPACDRPKLIR